MHIEGAWVAYLDAFGFSAAVGKRPEAQINGFFEDLYRQLAAAKPKLAAAYQFSDSVFLIQKSFPDPSRALEQLIIAIEDLQRIALQYRLVFRGAIAFGSVTFGGFGCYGSPVVDAARLEPHLAVPLVVLPTKYIERANDYLRKAYNPDSGLGLELPTKSIRTKTGLISAYIVPPPDRLYANVAHKEIHRSLIDGPDHVAPAWQAALELLNFRETSEGR